MEFIEKIGTKESCQSMHKYSIIISVVVFVAILGIGQESVHPIFASCPTTF